MAHNEGQSDHAEKAASDLLDLLFRSYRGGLSARLWSGTSMQLGKAAEKPRPPFTLIFRSPQAVLNLAIGRAPLRWIDAYLREDIDIDGDLFSALALNHPGHLSIGGLDRLESITAALRLKLAILRSTPHRNHRPRLFSRRVNLRSRAENLENVAFHNTLPGAFYGLWLDTSMVYSCAYFKHIDDELEQAQQQKLHLICRKLMLKRGDHLLDIGCGWGALIIYAARSFGVRAHGITTNRQQRDIAREKICEAGLQDLVTVEVSDCHTHPGRENYDKVTSLGMFEHVGLENLPRFFTAVYRLLKPGGLFLNQGITHDVHGLKETLSTLFIDQYIFPAGQLDTVSHIQHAMEHCLFEIADVEALRHHYALTLRRWLERFEANKDQVLGLVTKATYRTWRLYMTACALEFEFGDLGAYQILSSKRAARFLALPLTRNHLMANEKKAAGAALRMG
ncbi:SAM-dependent methyltransferase [Pseudomonas syringae]|uniref:SAM-dependent methyltransferase n=1 Tax=Pseudomonas syringae TaxID=317 RepID=UPI000A8442FE|nr:cyclopropane-fatty-acyl-phospholipid synthase family protein [Pseudomonas syringae]